jgi:predicted nucleic acid-binding protein
MKIAITDANIFIDLIYLELHGELFALGVEIHSTLEVYDELNQIQQAALAKFVQESKLTLHLRGEDGPPDNIQKQKGLSESDKLVLHLAIKLDAFVLTGDGLLRKISKGNKIEIHGIFWLFDRFIEKKLITKKRACQCLSDLIGYNKRLPQEECDKRLAEWAS